jgi:O-acetyl-ADP-ribose deacetylase (regulator of RNase III)
MHLILVDPATDLCAAWQKYFVDLPNVEIVAGKFERLTVFDCLVSPANSFGIMDGGVDAAITRFFGEQLMQRVQKRILTEFRGEQPVGTSIIVPTTHPKHPYLAHTPTMRYPMSLLRTDAVYVAMWAMLNAVANFNATAAQPIAAIACPGLGTGTGAVPALEGARQMALAYRNFLNPPTTINWHYATQRQDDVRFGGYYGFHLPMEGERSTP